MTHDQVQQWLDAYIEAWSSGDVAAISGLFSVNAEYGYRPWDSEKTTVTGNDAIAASWLENPDDPATWEATYEPYVVEGDKAVALGSTRYKATGDHPERTYHNAFVLRFDADGKCSQFHEFYVLKKS
jgi:ketosteroid isomerase-like protein